MFIRWRNARFLALSLVLLILVARPLAIYAAEATLSDIILTNTREDLLVFFEIKGCFTREMEEAIQNGIPTTFTIFINFYRTRTFWLDQTIASIRVEHTIKYDSLKNEFRVKRSEDQYRESNFADFAAAKKAMAEIKSIKIAPLSELVKNSKYQLRIKAELEKVRLPLYLHYVLFFVSLWDFETDWYTVDFIY
jgi:hypothetical protein